jgi:hypothetical protein
VTSSVTVTATSGCRRTSEAGTAAEIGPCSILRTIAHCHQRFRYSRIRLASRISYIPTLTAVIGIRSMFPRHAVTE